MLNIFAFSVFLFSLANLTNQHFRLTFTILSPYCMYCSVSALPDNPYLRPEAEAGRGRTSSSNGGEEVYYSDSDDDSASRPAKNSVHM